MSTKDFIKALDAIAQAVRVAQGVDDVDDSTYGKLDEILYLVEELREEA